MPFVPNTPESHNALLSRSDSKNRATTCHGVVPSTGLPCRRALVSSKSGQPSSGVITRVNGEDSFFCNQHKEQAQDVVLRHTASFTRRREALGRGSMDTLIEQVELLVAGGSPGGTTATTVVSTTKPVPWHQDPFAANSNSNSNSSSGSEPSPPSPPLGFRKEKVRPRKKGRSRFVRMLCCISEQDAEDDEEQFNTRKSEEAELRAAAASVVENNAEKPKAHRKGGRVVFQTTPPTPPLPMMFPKKPAMGAMAKHGPVPTAVAGSRTTVAGRGMSPATPNSAADDEIQAVDPRKIGKDKLAIFSLIPAHLTPKTTLLLQQELSKPFSPGDEPGYIYIFWLTDTPISPAPTPTKNLDVPLGKSSTAKALAAAAAAAESFPQKKRLLLKIGRANNVQRRLHQWSTQCNYNLSLVRYYPHVSSSTTPSLATTPNAGPSTPTSQQVGRKVPNSHRIERLIHLELRDNEANNPQHKCEVCKKMHLEWFQVEASRAGLRGADEVVKRWVEYGERYGVMPPPTKGLGSTPTSSTGATASSTPTPSGKKKTPVNKAKNGPPKAGTGKAGNGNGKTKTASGK